MSFALLSVICILPVFWFMSLVWIVFIQELIRFFRSSHTHTPTHPLSSLYFTSGHCFILMIFCLGLSVTFSFTHFLFLPNLILLKWQGLQISFSGKCLTFGSSASRCWNLTFEIKILWCEDGCEVWLDTVAGPLFSWTSFRVPLHS